jgi:hypothetical protein
MDGSGFAAFIGTVMKITIALGLTYFMIRTGMEDIVKSGLKGA